MALTEPIRDPAHVKAMMDYYLQRGEYRNYCFLGFGVYSALRVSDIICLRWGDVYDFGKARFNKRIQLAEGKTKKTKAVCVNEHLTEILRGLKAVLESSGECLSSGTYIFRSRKGDNSHITRQHAYRITKEAADQTGVEGTIGCHSLRKTFGYAAQQSGAPPAVIMDIFNHSSYQITKRYLGIEQDEKDAVYKKVNFR